MSGNHGGLDNIKMFVLPSKRPGCNISTATFSSQNMLQRQHVDHKIANALLKKASALLSCAGMAEQTTGSATPVPRHPGKEAGGTPFPQTIPEGRDPPRRHAWSSIVRRAAGTNGPALPAGPNIRTRAVLAPNHPPLNPPPPLYVPH
jgi:hypothetical protein